MGSVIHWLRIVTFAIERTSNPFPNLTKFDMLLFTSWLDILIIHTVIFNLEPSLSLRCVTNTPFSAGITNAIGMRFLFIARWYLSWRREAKAHTFYVLCDSRNEIKFNDKLIFALRFSFLSEKYLLRWLVMNFLLPSTFFTVRWCFPFFELSQSAFFSHSRAVHAQSFVIIIDCSIVVCNELEKAFLSRLSVVFQWITRCLAIERYGIRFQLICWFERREKMSKRRKKTVKNRSVIFSRRKHEEWVRKIGKSKIDNLFCFIRTPHNNN